ncbi:hypothetical protein GC173_05510 [bacterium]|nr:hypothetical protein [bacterium]
MTRKPLAFLSMDSLEGYFTYDHLPAAILEQRGWQVEYPSWRSDADWQRFAAVIIRSPWDYQHDPDRYMATLRYIASLGVPVHNSVDIVEWNLRKTYLKELDQRGVPLIPTIWRDALAGGDLHRHSESLDSSEIVVKPILGANADGAFRLSAPFDSPQAAEALRTYAAAPFQIQPFLRSIVEFGEVSLFYFGSQYSHAVHKKPKAGDFRVQEEHGGILSPIVPVPGALAVADKVMAELPGATLYARVDLVILNDGNWAVMEVELNEPSLYFNIDPDSPRRFADAVEQVVVG